MKSTVEAIFEDGVFKPVERPEIPEGEHVQLTVETTTRPEREDPIELAARVYRGLRPEEIDEIERIVLRPWARGQEQWRTSRTTSSPLSRRGSRSRGSSSES